MKHNPHKTFFTNIDVTGKDFKHVIKLKPEMIIIKEPIPNTRGEQKFKLKLNIEFWKTAVLKYKELNIILDEAHVLFNPRRSMSKVNIIMTDFLALLRRVLGSSDNIGELILITQLSRRLDIIAKEMATDVSFCVHHYKVKCSKCKALWMENNEMANKFLTCPRCHDYRIKKVNSIIEVYEFKNVDDFITFKDYKVRKYTKRYLIKNISEVFGNYNTLQFEDLLSNY